MHIRQMPYVLRHFFGDGTWRRLASSIFLFDNADRTDPYRLSRRVLSCRSQHDCCPQDLSPTLMVRRRRRVFMPQDGGRFALASPKPSTAGATLFSRDRVNVLISVDSEKTDFTDVAGWKNDGDYPQSWYQHYGAGPTFYTALGHRENIWTGDATYRSHVVGAIRWILRLES